MHYWELPEHAWALSDTALNELKANEIAPLPANYELWFHHSTGQEPLLSQAVAEALASGKARDHNYMRALRARYCDGTGEAVGALNAKLEHEVALLTGVVEGVGKDTSSYGRTLGAAVEQLRDQDGASARLKAIAHNILVATRAMEERNKALDTQLKSSSAEMAHLRSRLEAVRRESVLDPLTGLLNRRGLEERVQDLIAATRSRRAGFSVLMTDIDHFKRFNDSWGHPVGDQVISLVAHTIKANVRAEDLVVRYGGEEFLILITDTALKEAADIAEKIRAAMESRKLVKRSTGEALGTVTLSFGVTEYCQGETIEDAIRRADACLYGAKRTGRNRVSVTPAAVE